MADKVVNDVGKSSGGDNKIPNTQEQTIKEGSIGSLLTKSSDYGFRGQRIYRRIDSYPKNRRYAHLQLTEMFANLVSLYRRAFAANWSHFKRTGDSISPPGTSAADSQGLMSRVYISHWMLDLYSSVRRCVKKTSVIALNEAFGTEIPGYSNEYDAYLVALNHAIRPTHLLGCHEDVMFIPHFPDNCDVTTPNPFGITGFIKSYDSLKMILTAMKDKRAGWNISTITTDVTGRPSWLFDWFNSDTVCSWFPMEGNFDSTDISIAYILGVACTPKLAPVDDDEFQPLPQGMTRTTIDTSLIRRINERKVFADYEVDSFKFREMKFNVYQEDSTHPPTETESSARKRTRSSRDRRDTTVPGSRSQPSTSIDDMQTEVTLEYVKLRTYLYYGRVILEGHDRERYNALLSFITDPVEHCTY